MRSMRAKSASTSSSNASTRASSTECSPKSSQPRRGNAASRALSAAVLVLKGAVAFSETKLKVQISGSLDCKVQVSVPGTKTEGNSLPETCAAGKTYTASFSASSTSRSSATKGTLLIGGFEAIAFCLAHNEGTSWVYSKGRYRHTALAAEKWDWRGKGEKPTEAKAADLELVGGRATFGAGMLKASLRPATELELKRCLQLQALREAKELGEYETLHAQVAKAKMAGVELEHIESAEERLKELRKQRLHIDEGCDKDTLRSQLVWNDVTRRPDAVNTNEPCTVSAECPCNEPENCGEVLRIVPNAVQECLKEFGPEADQDLFNELVTAALAVEEGSVWRAGGKFIFSAFDRNQSVFALTRMLQSHGRERCAKMLLQMVKNSEQEYGGYVTAIQVNFHPHGSTFHSQHRDIYSAKQRAGPNCTCSFKKCVGTVCYTIGSSRMCLLEAMTDEMSSIKACCEQCQGRREKVWLHSGDAMYFNETWNANHTHGIPALPEGESCGPRISIAFLLGADESRFTLFAPKPLES